MAKAKKGYFIPEEPYFEPIVYISVWTSKSVNYHSPFSARHMNTGEVVQAETLEKLYRKLAYRAAPRGEKKKYKEELHEI
jgi:hypothetical protein